MKEPEETGSMEPLQAASHEIVFDHVNFSYVPGEPVLKQASFTVPDQKLTAIVGDSGSGKSTILNLIAKYYEVSGGTISIGGRPINHVAAERVLDQISMVTRMCSCLMIQCGRISTMPVRMLRTQKLKWPAERQTVTALSARWRGVMIRRLGKMEISCPAANASAFP